VKRVRLFSNSEYINIVFVYGEARGSAPREFTCYFFFGSTLKF
jgi:hypothetical protein